MATEHDKSLQVDLPDELRAFAENQAVLGGFRSVGEYLRDVVRQELRRVKRDRVERLLIDGLKSGRAVKVTAESSRKRPAALRAKATTAKKPLGRR